MRNDEIDRLTELAIAATEKALRKEIASQGKLGLVNARDLDCRVLAATAASAYMKAVTRQASANHASSPRRRPPGAPVQ